MKIIPDLFTTHFYNASSINELENNESSQKEMSLSSHISEVKMGTCDIKKPFESEVVSMEMILPKEDVGRDILRDVRLLFKGGKYKSCNKIIPNKPFTDRMNCLLGYIKIKEINNLRKEIEKSTELKISNCDTMAKIAYVLSEGRGLTPKYNQYVTTDFRFHHMTCQVNINEIYYIIDPWANIFCKKEDFIQSLGDKISTWKGNGKLIIHKKIGGEDLFITDDKHKSIITVNDVSRLHLIDSEKLHEKSIQGVEFYTSLNLSLMKIKNNNYQEHELD